MHFRKGWFCVTSERPYNKFKTQHPDTKIGFTKFSILRPKECVLAGASDTHTVCVCTLHQELRAQKENDELLKDLSFSTKKKKQVYFKVQGPWCCVVGPKYQTDACGE